MSLGDVGFDTECTPNFWCAGFRPVLAPPTHGYIFEISERRNDALSLYQFLAHCGRLIGFNNLLYDWPMVSHLLKLLAAGITPTAEHMWRKNEEIFSTPWNDRWSHIVRRPSVPQIDMMAIHHLDRFGVGLKQLEMTMRSETVEDMPFAPGTWLTHAQMDAALIYNAKDINETVKCFVKSAKDIEYRETLGPEWINYNDGKIGSKFFEQELIKAGVPLWEESETRGRVKRQTRHPHGIPLASVILPCINFTRGNSLRALELIRSTVIEESKTKGGFSTSIDLDGFEIDVKLGGIHGSLERVVIDASDGIIKDFDVPSYYPSIAIDHNIYPAHLGPAFCEVYGRLRTRRLPLAKDDPVRSTLKFSLNVPFGQSNEKNSHFYDAAYMLAITINGQLMLCMLAEQFANAGIRLIQVNTDGVTIQYQPHQARAVEVITEWWKRITHMGLEEKEYRRMFIRDANNYIAEDTKGERKRIGAYDYIRTRQGLSKLFQSNASELVVARAAEAAMFDGSSVETYIQSHQDGWDFLLFRKGKLQTTSGAPLPHNFRYYISQTGEGMVALYPPLKGKTEPRRIGVHAEGQAEAIGTRKNYCCSICGHPFVTKGAFEIHNKQHHT